MEQELREKAWLEGYEQAVIDLGLTEKDLENRL